MEIRTILAAASGGSATAGVIELACRMARRFNSHLEVFHARPDPREMAVAMAGGFGMPLAGNLIAQAERDAAAAALSARTSFDFAASRHALPRGDAPPPIDTDPALLCQASACWREEMGYSATAIADRARLFDLLIVGRSGRVVDEPYGDAIEEALLASGRPILVAPAEPPSALGETVAFAWNDTPESARALTASMPFLTAARRVHVLSLGDVQVAELINHLRWYGIRATGDGVMPVEHVGSGELLLAAARSHGADLLVMGAYGHAPWRELLFGGATHDVLRASLLPLLLCH